MNAVEAEAKLEGCAALAVLTPELVNATDVSIPTTPDSESADTNTTTFAPSESMAGEQARQYTGLTSSYTVTGSLVLTENVPLGIEVDQMPVASAIVQQYRPRRSGPCKTDS